MTRVWDLLDSDQYRDSYETEAEREPRDGAECIHVSYTEQAGGFVICDYCGEDITAEIFRSAAHEP